MKKLDFTKLGAAAKKDVPVHPIKLFETLPSLENTPNDLWRGQAEALENWNEVRKQKDVLVSLNTGAGKTIVGILIAQSLVNEGIENVVYVCSTIDLVLQTATEAKRIGVPCTLRTKQSFNNDLFETGKAFCITTYAALFNGHSAIRRKHFPGAIIFDDAHVAESLLRDAFTITIDGNDHPALFKEIADLFEPHFKEMGVRNRFKDSLKSSEHSTSMAAPRGVHERSARLLEVLERNKITEGIMAFPFAHIKDHIESCAVIFARGKVEIAPPFLPSLALDVFERPIRRIYLSATLQSQTEFVRAFGRLPSSTIVPSNDAGNGERLVVYGRDVEGGFSKEYIKKLSKKRKIVVAVPSYPAASKWDQVATPPDVENFSSALDDFREAENGAFILVSRVDGIDLPHDTCRIMLMEGLPSGTSLIERYQWEFLRMNNVHSVRIANRLAQLFGRINRGRNDYGVFFIEGKELNIWLAKDRNVWLLPPLLQKQVMLGREVQVGMSLSDTDTVTDAVDAVMTRNEGWLDYYKREVKLGELDKDQVERVQSAEPTMVQAALAEANFAAFMWNKDYPKARRELEKTIDDTATTDTPLGGWHSVWLGSAFDLEGDTNSANRAYSLARSRIGPAITLPKATPSEVFDKEQVSENAFARSLKSFLNFANEAKFKDEIQKMRATLQWISDGTPNQAEAGVRLLGEILGFSSTRPDNDEDTGPDVVWHQEEDGLVIGFELKTDKKNPALYFKKEIGQGHDHLTWLDENFEDKNLIGLLYVGPDGHADHKSHPSDRMGLCVTSEMAALRDRLLALIEDLRELTPLERNAAIPKESELAKWSFEKIVEKLWGKNLEKK